MQSGLEILTEIYIGDRQNKKSERKTRNCSNRGLYRPKQRNSKRNEG